MAITTRSGKGSPLTHNEMDANLSAITEKTSATGSVKGSSGTTAQRPASPVEGYTRFNTTLNRHETYNGSTWITAVSSANTDTSDMSFVVDEDAMTSDSATKVPTQQSVKAYVDSQVQSKDALSELSGTLDDVADGTTYVKSTNDFTDAEVTKLSGIETAATADQTNAEIKTAYEANADTNEFSDAEQTKLSGIEASADVTDSTNVASAGAVMESDTTTASMSFVIDQDDMSTDSATKVPTQQSVKAYVDSQVQSKDTLGELGGNLDDITDGTTYKKMSATEQTKLSGIEASADVTDTTNVTSAGALMDSEVTNLAQVKAFDTTDYATSTQGTTADNALPLAGGTMTGDVSLGDNVKAKFGASDDLQIYHDGSNSYVSDAGTGDLIIKAGGFQLIADNNDIFMKAFVNNRVEFYHDNVKRFLTTTTGVNVLGTLACDGFTSTGIDDNATSTAITIDASENVGIGTSSFTGANTFMDDLVVYNATAGTGAGLSIIGNATNGYSSIAFGDTADWDTGRLQYNHTDNSMAFHTNSAERMQISSAGNVTVKTGNLVIGTSGKGIDFSAATPDGTGTTGSEVLDDYEEGTWTPVIGGSSGTSGQTYATQIGRYTKTGNSVTCTFRVALSAKGTITGNAAISGLPFTITALTNYRATLAVGYFSALATTAVHLSGVGINNSTRANLVDLAVAAVSTAAVDTSNIGNTTRIDGVITYEV